MLSIENPSDPSCSPKASALKSDESASGKLAFQEADPAAVVGLPPNFSIRGYVFQSRSKDIETNWPFPQQFLQLCLNHGIRDLLPPFEPSNLVRAKCCRKGVESEQVTECSEAEQILENGEPDGIRLGPCLPSDQLVVGSSDQVRHPLPVEGELKVYQEGNSDDKAISGKAEIVCAVTSHDQIEGEIEVAIPTLLPEKLQISSEPSEKKCRLVVKLSSITETSGPEDLVSTLSTVSDSMASKVCPVCKTFASTSNTTLNAHIDQCLSSECNTKSDVSKFPEHKVKPRKKRMMVDIYTTAPHCTLEDLDRRNGTNWTTGLTLVSPTSEVNTVTKRPNLSPMVAMDDGNEGEVYVDSNGTKLRILSKFNDAPPVMSRKDFKLGMPAKDIKAGRSCLITKKKCFKSKNSKFMKVIPQSKRLSSLKLFKDEIQTTPRGDCDGDAHHEKEEESGSQLLNARDQIKISEPATLGQWVCSKRSDLSKKVNYDTHTGSGRTRDVTRNPLVESSSSAVRSHVLKFSGSSDPSASSPKTKRLDVLSNIAHVTDSWKKTSPKPSNLNSRLSSEADYVADGLVLKLPRSPGSFLSSPRSKREEIHMGTLKKSDTYSGTKTSPSKSYHPSLKARKSSTQKKIALLERPSFSLEASKGDGSEKLTKRFCKHRSILGSSKWGGGKMHSNVNGELQGSTKDSDLNSARAKESSKAHQSNSSDNVTGSNIPEYDQEKEDSGTVVLASDAKLDPCPAVEDHGEPISGSETQIKPLDQRSVNGQKIISKIIQTAGAELEQRVDENPITVQCGECRTNIASIQEPSPCLTSHGGGLEIAQEKSSITSVRITSDRDHNLATDMEPSGSPVSTTSAISPPEQSAKPTSMQDKLSSIIERKDKRVKGNPPAKEPRCSCSESLSRESQLSSRIGKQMVSNLYIRPALSSNACPSLESPTESILTKASSESAVKTPASCSDFGLQIPCFRAQTQAASCPILRLMGKDLVVSKEESYCDSDYSPKPNYLPLGFSSLAGVSNHGGFSHNYHQISSGSSVPGQVSLMGSHQIPLQSHLKRQSKKPNSPSPCRMERMVAPHQHRPMSIPSSQAPPYLTQDVIVIDDSPELQVEQPMISTASNLYLPSSNPMPQRPFSCFPPQNPFVSRAVRSSFPNPMKQGSNSEGPSPLLLRSPFMLSTLPLYNSQTLR